MVNIAKPVFLHQKQSLWLGFFALLALTACAGESRWPDPPPEGIDSSGGAESILKPNIAAGDGDGAEGGGPAAGQVGAPCAEKPECVTNYCMTTANMTPFVKGANVPGGYCSAIFCAVDGSDGACTKEMGGICFSLYPFLGDAFGTKGICLAPCSSDSECRPEETGICFDAEDLVKQGLMKPEIIGKYYSSASKACLPKSVADAAEKKLKEKQGE
jgi:hypothetical protein